MEKLCNISKIEYRRIADKLPNWNDIRNMDMNKLDEMAASKLERR
jgi:hypothetical protein